MNILKKITPYNKTIMDNKVNKYIVIHYVGEVSSAKNNIEYFCKNKLKSSAHYFVDNKEIWQLVEDKDSAWHCGTSQKYYHPKCRNTNSIGIEMCCKKDGKGKWYIKEETINNTIQLTKMLMQKYNIPIENIIRHYDVTRKVCPEPFVRNEDLWIDFKNRLFKGDEEEMIRYNKIEEIPEYAKTTIQKLINKGILKGTQQGLDLSEDMLRILVINDRIGLYDNITNKS